MHANFFTYIFFFKRAQNSLSNHCFSDCLGDRFEMYHNGCSCSHMVSSRAINVLTLVLIIFLNYFVTIYVQYVQVFCLETDTEGLLKLLFMCPFIILFDLGKPLLSRLMHLGQMFNGLAGPVAMAGPPAVSSVWFPTHQRTTATAIGTAFASAGTAVGFIIGMTFMTF